VLRKVAERPRRLLHALPRDTLCTMFDGNEFQAEVASCRELPEKSLSNTVPSESQKSNDGGRTRDNYVCQPECQARETAG